MFSHASTELKYKSCITKEKPIGLNYSNQVLANLNGGMVVVDKPLLAKQPYECVERGMAYGRHARDLHMTLRM